MSKIIFTDGSSRGNPGPGGWGAIIAYKDLVTELGGREDKTTNNRMELMAAIKSLETVDGESVLVVSDSEYVIKGITEWIFGWIKKGWKNSQNKPVLNKDLWERLYVLVKDKDIKWKYVRGHTGHPANERCDVIATSFADGLSTDLYTGEAKNYKISLKI